MVDYAISAIGRTDQTGQLTKIASGNEVRNFEEIGSHGQSSPWNTIGDFRDPFRIIQEPSPADAQLKTTMAPWDQVSSRAVDRLDHIQRDWNRTERDLFSPNESSYEDTTTAEGFYDATRAMLQDLLKSGYNMMNSQARLALVTSIATTFKSSISTLYRQQG